MEPQMSIKNRRDKYAEGYAPRKDPQEVRINELQLHTYTQKTQILELKKKDNIERISHVMEENTEYYSTYTEVKKK